jgi:hypothetical protein
MDYPATSSPSPSPPDGAQLAAASYDDDTVRLWDTSPAAARRDLREPRAADHPGPTGQLHARSALPCTVFVRISVQPYLRFRSRNDDLGLPARGW